MLEGTLDAEEDFKYLLLDAERWTWTERWPMLKHVLSIER